MRSLLTRFKSSSAFPAVAGALVAAGGAQASEACSTFLTIYGPIEWWFCSLIGPYGNSCFYSCFRIARTAILEF